MGEVLKNTCLSFDLSHQSATNVIAKKYSLSQNLDLLSVLQTPALVLLHNKTTYCYSEQGSQSQFRIQIRVAVRIDSMASASIAGIETCRLNYPRNRAVEKMPQDFSCSHNPYLLE